MRSLCRRHFPLFLLFLRDIKKTNKMRKIDLIVIHCTASRPDQHLTLEMLDQMHQARGWKCCGYHYYITRDGQLHFGRPEETTREASTNVAALPTPAPLPRRRPSSRCSAP